jgi:glycosyltransferase involved in cell wall biosynthesis
VTAVVVVDNGSTDRTAEVAACHGGCVVRQPERGYGAACLLGIETARQFDPEVLVFLDGDYSDHPEEMPALLAPIRRGDADFVIGSRTLGERASGALLPQARLGNWLACTVMRAIWGGRFTDLGPFRAIRLDALDRLRMRDRNYGWTIEMQIRALECGLPYAEVPVSYRPRIGQSKVTGTIRGTLGASAKILGVIAVFAVRRLLRIGSGARSN